MENNEMRIDAVDNLQSDTSVDYISAINEIKANSVSKAEYEKLRQENQSLLKTLVENGQIEQSVMKEPTDVNALRNELFDPTAMLSNLEYVSKALELRDAVIDNGGVDPFLPYRSSGIPTTEEINTANRVADVLKECVEYADGDSQIFTQELMRRTDDAMPNRGKR